MLYSVMSDIHSVSLSAGLFITVLILLIGFNKIKYFIQF